MASIPAICADAAEAQTQSSTAMRFSIDMTPPQATKCLASGQVKRCRAHGSGELRSNELRQLVEPRDRRDRQSCGPGRCRRVEPNGSDARPPRREHVVVDVVADHQELRA